MQKSSLLVACQYFWDCVHTHRPHYYDILCDTGANCFHRRVLCVRGGGRGARCHPVSQNDFLSALMSVLVNTHMPSLKSAFFDLKEPLFLEETVLDMNLCSYQVRSLSQKSDIPRFKSKLRGPDKTQKEKKNNKCGKVQKTPKAMCRVCWLWCGRSVWDEADLCWATSTLMRCFFFDCHENPPKKTSQIQC